MSREWRRINPTMEQTKHLLTGRMLENIDKNGLPFETLRSTRDVMEYFSKWYDPRVRLFIQKKPYQNWTLGKNDIDEVNKDEVMCPPCLYCLKPTNDKASIRYHMYEENETTLLICRTCYYRIGGDHLGAATDAVRRWKKAACIIDTLQSYIAPNNRYIYGRGLELELDVELDSFEFGQIDRKNGIVIFGEEFLHMLLVREPVNLNLDENIKFFRIGKQTLLNHRREFNPGYMLKLLRYQEKTGDLNYQPFKDYCLDGSLIEPSLGEESKLLDKQEKYEDLMKRIEEQGKLIEDLKKRLDRG